MYLISSSRTDSLLTSPLWLVVVLNPEHQSSTRVSDLGDIVMQARHAVVLSFVRVCLLRSTVGCVPMQTRDVLRAPSLVTSSAQLSTRYVSLWISAKKL